MKKSIALILTALMLLSLPAWAGALEGNESATSSKIKAFILERFPISVLNIPENNTSPATSPEGGLSADLPDFQLLGPDGEALRFHALFDGRPVVLNFWASWCGPCRREMPDFDALYQEYGDRVRFVMVNLTDQWETVETAQAFIEEQGYSFPVYFDSLGEGANAFGVSGIPVSYFLSAQGELVSSFLGAMSEWNLREGLEGLLGS